jgi:REP element-mobilizing transposase RayT
MIYTFMPDHVHTISIGTTADSNGLHSMERFKQRTGWWLKSNHPQIKWQRSFWDRISRSTYEEAQAAWYVVNNPVRRGLVETWTDYPFTGAIGLDLKEYLADLQPFA